MYIYIYIKKLQKKTKSKNVIKLAATPRNTDWQKVPKTGGDADCKSDDETLCATERRESSGTSTVVNKLNKKIQSYWHELIK